MKWAAVSVLLGATLLACQSAVDPYFDEVADAQDELVRETDIILEGLDSDLDACERSVFSLTACDRAIDKLDEWRVAINQTRLEVDQLSAPSAAAAWNRDYLNFLRDASNWLNDIVNAYHALDDATFFSQLDRFDSFVQREDRLIEQFEEIQRELGAR